MFKAKALLIAFCFALSLAPVASAHDNHRFGHRSHVRVIRTYPARTVRVVRVRRPVRVLGVRYYSQYNYGRRRSALARHQRFERRRLHRRLAMERRLAHNRWAYRHRLARHYR
jgi:hypothetical protein